MNSSEKTAEDEEMLEECESSSEQLTDWESKFIDDISRYSVLTVEQRRKLKQIWEKISG